jgi:branched-chain amino acid transport system substrate-binding protein
MEEETLMIRRVSSTLGIVLCLSILLVGCGSDPIVGVLLPTTGDAAVYGESIESGIRLAVNQARELDQLPPGFQVESADSGSDAAKAQEALRWLVNERRVKLIIGGATSGEASSILPLLEELQMICLSPSASMPSLTRDSRYFFRIFPSDELEGNAAAKFLRDRMKKGTVLIYSGDTEYTRGIEPEFLSVYEGSLGGKVVGRVDLTSEVWAEQSVEQLAAGEPEAVYVVDYAERVLTVLEHLREQSFEGNILTTSAFYNTDVIQRAGSLAEDVIFPLPPFDRTSENEPVLGFVQRYMDTYQRAPDTFAAHGYDAMRIAIEVMRITKSYETGEINKALHFGVSEFMGVTGPILFDDFGDVKHYPKMFIVKDSQVLSYQRYMKAERERILREVQNLLVKEQ